MFFRAALRCRRGTGASGAGRPVRRSLCSAASGNSGGDDRAKPGGGSNKAAGGSGEQRTKTWEPVSQQGVRQRPPIQRYGAFRSGGGAADKLRPSYTQRPSDAGSDFARRPPPTGGEGLRRSPIGGDAGNAGKSMYSRFGGTSRAPGPQKDSQAKQEPMALADPPAHDPILKKSVLDISQEDVGSFSFIPANKNEKVFGMSAPNVPLLKENERRFQGSPFMVREPLVKLVAHINGITAESVASKIAYLDGVSGAGRSSVLAHCVYAAREKGWLSLYVPRLFRWLDYNTYIIHDPRDEKTEDGLHRYDQPALAISTLEAFREQNREQLKTRVLSQTYTLGKRQIQTKDDTTMLELIGFGIDNYLAASDVFGAIIEELRRSHEPVLVAVDEMNAMFYTRCDVIDMATVDKAIADPQTMPHHKVPLGWKYCRPHQMNMLRHLCSLFTDKGRLNNGLLVAAPSSAGNLLPFDKKNPARITSTETATLMTHKNLGDMGFHELALMERVQTESLNIDEIKSLLNYYRYSKWVNWEPSKLSPVEVGMMTAYNAKAISRLCDTL